MLEPGGEPDLPLEALGAEGGGKLGEEDLERDRAVVLEVLGEVDRGHAAAPELALEGVAVGESRLEQGLRVHRKRASVEGRCSKSRLDEGGDASPRASMSLPGAELRGRPGGPAPGVPSSE